MNGDGKSSLDGAFGRLGRNICDSVRNRDADIPDAASCLAAYQKDAGIRGAAGAILWLDRDKDLSLTEKSSVSRLLSSHRLVLHREKK